MLMFQHLQYEQRESTILALGGLQMRGSAGFSCTSYPPSVESQ